MNFKYKTHCITEEEYLDGEKINEIKHELSMVKFMR